MFVVPFLPSRSAQTHPVYTVDLVGGERIGGTNYGTTLKSLPAPKEAPKKKTPDPPAAPLEPKKETKKKEAEVPKPVSKKAPANENKPIPTESKIKTSAKKEPVKEPQSDNKSEQASLNSVRERLLQSAVERAKSRTENAQKASKEESISSGSGEGEGAAVLGKGGRGGGIVKGLEFIIYQNRMLSTIKENWAWVGQRTNLRVVVRFGIRENGEITGLKVVERSGDPSYDESVLRALKKSSPLPAPPEGHRKDFADIELTFRPRDLGA